MICGLLGKKLSHSYSAQIHSYLGQYNYTLFEQEPDSLSSFFRHGAFTGINVTVPYKKAVIPFCAELSDTARKLGSVNTIVKTNNGAYIGHNTDYFGFSSMLKKSGLSVEDKKVLVLGSGGASATAAAVLREAGADVIIISRSGDDHYGNLKKHVDASVIVNATPVGMYPGNGASLVDLSLFPNLEGVLDLVYNPARTKLLMDAEQRGLVWENGLWMLVCQAKESAEWFTGTKISDSIIPHIYGIIAKQMQNIVLIGMPGAGKSAVGKLLAQKLGRQYIDSDAEIEKHVQMPICQYISLYGEDRFRTAETQVLAEIGKSSSAVIATGGGCVTKRENYPLLHQNGRIIWLKRNISELSTEGRPLSDGHDLNDMFKVRMPLYSNFADLSVSNNDSLMDTVDRILTLEEYK